MQSFLAEEDTYLESGPSPVVLARPLTSARITVKSGRLAGRSFDVAVGTTILGRGVHSDIRIEDGGLSRRHAKLVRAADGTCKIHDLHSTNGTFVNEQRIELDVLRAGDRIRLAGIELTYEQTGPANADEPKAPVDRGVALASHRQTLEVREHQFGPNHPALAPLLRKIGRLQVDMGDVRAGISTYERARAIYESLPGDPPPELPRVCLRLGEAYLRIGQHIAARTPLMQAEALLVDRPASDRQLARARFALAKVKHATGDRPGAHKLAVMARDGLRAAGPKARVDHDRVSDWIIAHGG